MVTHIYGFVSCGYCLGRLGFRPAPDENGIERYFQFCSKKSLLMGPREVFGKSAKLLAEVLVSEDAPYIHLLQRLFHF